MSLKTPSENWFERTAERAYLATIVAVARYGALFVQFALLRVSDHDQWVSWVFLPAGVAVIAALVLGNCAVPGLVLGSFLWNMSGHPMPLLDNVLLSLASGLAAWLTLLTFRRLKGFSASETWRNYSVFDIIGFLGLHAALNSGLNHLIFLLPASKRHFAFESLGASLVGDFAGGLLLFVMLNLLMALVLFVLRRT